MKVVHSKINIIAYVVLAVACLALDEFWISIFLVSSFPYFFSLFLYILVNKIQKRNENTTISLVYYFVSLVLYVLLDQGYSLLSREIDEVAKKMTVDELEVKNGRVSLARFHIERSYMVRVEGSCHILQSPSYAFLKSEIRLCKVE